MQTTMGLVVRVRSRKSVWKGGGIKVKEMKRNKVSRSKKQKNTYVCECSGVNSWSHPSKQQEVYKRGEEESSGGSGRYRIGHQYIRESLETKVRGARLRRFRRAEEGWWIYRTNDGRKKQLSKQRV